MAYCKLQLDSSHITLATKPVVVEVSCRMMHCTQLSPGKPCVAAQLTVRNWAERASPHAGRWLGVGSGSAERGKNCSLENVKLHFQMLTCKAINLSRKQHRLPNSLIYAWFAERFCGSSVALFYGRLENLYFQVIKNSPSSSVSSPTCNCFRPHPLHHYTISMQFVNMYILCLEEQRKHPCLMAVPNVKALWAFWRNISLNSKWQFRYHVEAWLATKSTGAEDFPLLYSRNRRIFSLVNPGNFLFFLLNCF